MSGISIIHAAEVGLTKREAGMSIPVKCVEAPRHQMVNTAMSHAYTFGGRLNCSVPSEMGVPVGNLSPLSDRNKGITVQYYTLIWTLLGQKKVF